MFTTRFYLTLIFSLVLTAKTYAFEPGATDSTFLKFSGKIQQFVRARTVADFLAKLSSFRDSTDVQVYALPEDISVKSISLVDAAGLLQHVKVCKTSGDIYIRFKSSVTDDTQAAILKRFKLHLLNTINTEGLHYAKTRPDNESTPVDPVLIAAALQQCSEVAFVEPDLDGTSRS